ncbi:hypothetical protein ACQ5SO_13615 [Rhodovulum sp. DZ06]|uniref:hypothetical protein n=1 Tax=Rhodovulum sp. DZ06 TaxID=3425126 RepID=UPI003D33058D
MKILIAAGLGALLACSPAAAQDSGTREFALKADPALAEAGLLKHLLVRFRLKTRRSAVMAEGAADVTLLATGRGTPAIAREGTLWRLAARTDNPAAQMFAEWLLGDIGRGTIESFTPKDGAPFTAPDLAAIAEEAPEFDGDPVQGRALAAAHCGRCHAVGGTMLTAGIGSSPSFAALRALPDWADRFMAFYALNPHPAIMQVEGITPPFDPQRPPPMIPIEITLEEAEHIQAYAASVEAADLGAPVEAR